MDEIEKHLRSKYGIAPDIPVRRDFPRPDAIQEPSFIRYMGQSFGAQEWMWKTSGGRLLAAILIAGGLGGQAQFWSSTINESYELASPYIQLLDRVKPALGNRWIAFSSSAQKDQPLFSQHIDDDTILVPDSNPPSFNDIEQGVYHGVIGSLTLWRLVQSTMTELPLGHRFDEARWLNSSHRIISGTDDMISCAMEFYKMAQLFQGSPLNYPSVIEFSVESDIQVLSDPNQIPNNPSGRQALINHWLSHGHTGVLQLPNLKRPDRSEFYVNLLRVPLDKIREGRRHQLTPVENPPV